MTTSPPATAFQWTIEGTAGVDSLVLGETNIPEIGDAEVLVKIKGASLNFRDILITQGKYPFDLKPHVVLGSDGAGTVLAVGKNVTRFQPGDKVITMLNQGHIAGPVTPQVSKVGQLGGGLDGTLRTIGAFSEQGLVKMPDCLSFVEAATLSCAGVTAWNALFGLSGKAVTAGQWVLTQGTGGVSVFAIQFARAVGARVIATTSSNDKAEFLKKLGAEHVINYRDDETWGATAKALTDDIGVDLVVEVAGPSSLAQSAAAVKLDGTLAVVGYVGGSEGQNVPSLLDTWLNLYTSRGIWVGNRMQMEEMCRAIEAHPESLRPVVDAKVFELEQLKDAMEYLSEGQNLGKVCISLD